MARFAVCTSICTHTTVCNADAKFSIVSGWEDLVDCGSPRRDSLFFSDAGTRLPLQAAAPAPAPGASQNGADVLFIMEAEQVRSNSEENSAGVTPAHHFQNSLSCHAGRVSC